MNAGDIIGSESIVVEDGGVRISQVSGVHSMAGENVLEVWQVHVLSVSELEHGPILA